MIEVGFFSFCFALLLSIYAILASAYCFYRPYAAILSSARNAIIGVFLCVFFSSLILWNALFYHDYSVQYVFQHSAANMPPIYLFTSFWSALEGSHLLWTLLLSLVCTVSISNVRKNNLVYLPSLCLCFAIALTFMLLLNVTISAPLTRLFPVGQVGQGMNALLQNPYMAIHPPMLFTGYSLLIVPFAYGVGALVKGYFSLDWFVTVRKASLIAWAFLTVAIFLGGKWAYYELGWGGYWAWDPVENSSFMPWLALTASLHAFLIYTRTKRLPRLALFLIMLAFALTFQGTFITRSGIISSVHSFAESNIGPAYLAWILFLLTGILSLLFTRGSLLEGAGQIQEWKLSKESLLLFTLFFLLFTLALVFIGTLLPLVVEAIRGVKISIQQPFFNSFAPWIGLGFVSLLGVGNLMQWKTGKISNPIYCLLFPAILSLFVTVLFYFQKNLDLKVAFGYFMVFWTSFVLVMDVVFKLKELHWNGLRFLQYKRGYLGATIVHMGFLMALLGFTGNYQTSTAEVNLNLHQSTIFHGYEITNKGLSYKAEYNVQYVAAILNAINKDTQENVVITPARSKFTNNEQWFNEVGVYSTFWHDIYLVLSSFDVKTESISLKMNYNPTVKFVWTSLVVAVFGILISLSQGLTMKKSNSQSKLFSGFIVLFVFSCLLFGYSGMAHADMQIPTQTDPKLVEVAKELRCPTCLGMSILESETPQSVAMRTEIAHQLTLGKNKNEIVAYFKDRYGPWILRAPDASSSYGFFIWVIPILGLLGGPLFILIGLRRSQKKKLEKRKQLLNDIEKVIYEMRNKGNI